MLLLECDIHARYSHGVYNIQSEYNISTSMRLVLILRYEMNKHKRISNNFFSKEIV